MKKLLILFLVTSISNVFASLEKIDEKTISYSNSYFIAIANIGYDKEEVLKSLSQSKTVKKDSINKLLNYLRTYNSSDDDMPLPNAVELNKYMETGTYNSLKFFNFLLYQKNLTSININNLQKKYNIQQFNKEMYAEHWEKNQENIKTFSTITHNILRAKAIKNNLRLKPANILEHIDSIRKIIYFYEPTLNLFVISGFLSLKDRDYNIEKYYFMPKNILSAKMFIMDNNCNLICDSGLLITNEKDEVLIDRYYGKQHSIPYSTPFVQINYTPKIDKKDNQSILNYEETEEHDDNFVQQSNDFTPVNSKRIIENQPIDKTLKHDTSEIVSAKFIPKDEKHKNIFYIWLDLLRLSKPKNFNLFIPTSENYTEAAKDDFVFFSILNKSSEEYPYLTKLIFAISAAEEATNTNEEIDSLVQPEDGKMHALINDDLDILKNLKDKKRQECIDILQQQLKEKSQQRIKLEQQWEEIRNKVIEGTSGQKGSKKKSNVKKIRPLNSILTTTKEEATSKLKTEKQYFNEKLKNIKTKKVIKIQEAMSLINYFLGECGIDDDTNNIVNITITGSHYTIHIKGDESFTLVFPHGKNKGFFKGRVLYNFLSNIIKLKTKDIDT